MPEQGTGFTIEVGSEELETTINSVAYLLGFDNDLGFEVTPIKTPGILGLGYFMTYLVTVTTPSSRQE